MSTQDPATGYAFWISPDGLSKVVYSLHVFQEIDASVNEGFRQIPHGGVETGGLLFGRKKPDGIHVEAYRAIQCQHAFGPSFVLSESDLVGIREQLAAASSDKELAGLEPVGWFIGHTRSPLQLNARETIWFDQFFPHPGSLTLLVKPERFQATRFAFLLRNQTGQMEPDARHTAVILPLSGQSAQSANVPSPSIPAPQRTVERAVPTPSPEMSAPRPGIAEAANDGPAIDEPATGEPTRIRTSPFVAPAFTPPPVAPPTFHPGEPVGKNQPGLAYPYASLAPGRTRAARREAGGFGLKSAAVLVLAAVLGCIAGYWAYLQLPSLVIPARVREQRGLIVVEWPSAQTDNVDYAALQVNDGQWIALSSEQKANGHATIAAPSGDLKIDLVAKHWLRDSRGIVRYIRLPAAAR